jgi:tetratricopeptide (TPR) repeat protein
MSVAPAVRRFLLLVCALAVAWPCAGSLSPAWAAQTTPAPGRVPEPVDPGALKAQAAERIRAQDIRGARELYRRVLEQSPDDVEARFGYARTSAWLQQYAEAEAAYREGLARAPRSVEGLLGLADVLAWTGRYDEALDRLVDADAIEPGNPEVWRRRGRFNRWRGDRVAARAAYLRTLEVAPGDAEATRALAEMAAEFGSALDLEYTHESLSTAKARRLGTDSNNLAALQYSYSFDRVTVLGRVNYSDRYGDDDQDLDDLQFTGGFAWRLRPGTTLRAELSGAPDADTLPAFAGEVELLQGLRPGRLGGIVLGIGYRYLDFNRVVRATPGEPFPFEADPATRTHIETPSVEWSPRDSLTLLVRYYLAVSDTETIPGIPGVIEPLVGGTDTTSSVLVRATFFPGARFAPFVTYARGVESFATSAALLGLTTDSYAAGATLRLTPRVAVRAAVEYQDSGRDTAGGAINQTNFTGGVSFRW